IHHRVRNNLQVVLSVLHLQAGFIQDKQAKAWFQESEHRVKTMVLVHEQLYRADNLSRIDFAEYVRALVAYLGRSLGPQLAPIAWRVEVDNVFLGIDAAIRCGLIINELATNALKHAFPNGRAGEIAIEMRAD